MYYLCIFTITYSYPNFHLRHVIVTDTEMSLPWDPNRIIRTHRPFKILPSKRAPTN